MLRVEQKKAAQLGAQDACQFDSGRDAPSACKFFILDASEFAQELGLPTCSEVNTFFAVGLEGILLKHLSSPISRAGLNLETL